MQAESCEPVVGSCMRLRPAEREAWVRAQAGRSLYGRKQAGNFTPLSARGHQLALTKIDDRAVSVIVGKLADLPEGRLDPPVEPDELLGRVLSGIHESMYTPVEACCWLADPCNGTPGSSS